MNEEQKNDNSQTPDFSEDEMKMPENATPITPTEEKSAASGVIILILGVLLLGILVGLYMWFVSLNNEQETVPTPTIERPTEEENDEPESTTAEARTDNMETTSSSDEIAAIESDIESTEFESFDSEMNSIDSEFEAEASNN